MKISRFTAILFLVLAPPGELHQGLHAQPSYREVEVTDGGTIKGSVRLSGEVPRRMMMVVSKDEKYCGTGKPSPRLSVNSAGAVRNAIVWLEGIAEGKRHVRTSQRLVLDQSKCEYTPHILLLPSGSSLDIVNSDPVLHNVHTYANGDFAKTVFNIAQPVKGQRTTVQHARFRNHGLYLATCDAGHPWMNAYIMVTGHPYYALTDEDGRFKLTDVPPGTYTLRMWHEGVAVVKTELERGKPKSYRYEEPYEQTREATVAAGKTLAIEFMLALRPSQAGVAAGAGTATIQ